MDGNNIFAYFVDPNGYVIEYTAEVQQVDDSYKVGMPEDWDRPPGTRVTTGASPTAHLTNAGAY